MNFDFMKPTALLCYGTVQHDFAVFTVIPAQNQATTLVCGIFGFSGIFANVKE